jgi:hypothetical protein
VTESGARVPMDLKAIISRDQEFITKTYKLFGMNILNVGETSKKYNDEKQV